ncbi:hypothetical protein HAX54_009457, partial [Datura stramonium]|nr:hypothetical protein [Datura stramonium]
HIEFYRIETVRAILSLYQIEALWAILESYQIEVVRAHKCSSYRSEVMRAILSYPNKGKYDNANPNEGMEAPGGGPTDSTSDSISIGSLSPTWGPITPNLESYLTAVNGNTTCPLNISSTPPNDIFTPYLLDACSNNDCEESL